MSLQMKLIGDRELQRMLDQLPDASLRRVIRPGMSAAARPLTKAAKSEAPKVTRSLSKSIGVKNVTYKKSKTIVVIVGPRRGDKFAYVRKGKKKDTKHVPALYAHLVHDGTKPHFLSKTDTGQREEYTVRPKGNRKPYKRSRKIYRRHGHKHPGARPNPFLKRAWTLTRNRSMTILRIEVARRLPIEANKLVKKKS